MLSGNLLITHVGEDYVSRTFAIYAGRVLADLLLHREGRPADRLRRDYSGGRLYTRKAVALGAGKYMREAARVEMDRGASRELAALRSAVRCRLIYGSSEASAGGGWDHSTSFSTRPRAQDRLEKMR